MPNVLSTITVHINKYEMFCNFTMSEYCIYPLPHFNVQIYYQNYTSPIKSVTCLLSRCTNRNQFIETNLYKERKYNPSKLLTGIYFNKCPTFICYYYLIYILTSLRN